MIDKRVIAGGFIGGIGIGLIAIGGGHDAQRRSAEAPPPPQVNSSAWGIDPVPPNPPEPTFRQFVSNYAAQQGGRISLHELMALSDIYARAYGRQTETSALDSFPSLGVPDAAYGQALPQVTTPSLVEVGATRRFVDETETHQSAADAMDREPIQSMTDIGIGVTVPPPNTGAINTRTGQYMAPAGPGAYVDPRDGTFYAPAGPNGVVNSRTGEYDSVSH